MGNKAFTLIELLIIIAIFVILLAVGISSLRSFQREANLEDTAQEIKSGLQLAQNKAIASEGEQQHGIFFNDIVLPHSYTIFKGNNYASRDLVADEIHSLPGILDFSQVDFGGGKEVVFKRISGEPNQAGSVTLRFQQADTRAVSVDVSGVIFVGAINQPLDDNRIKDSRHVHVDYSRAIDVLTENVSLVFAGGGGPVVRDIKISDYIEGGNVVWSGAVTVDGEDQQLEIRTHRLNSPDTQFSITRDRRYNTKAFQVFLSGDGTGNLISYEVDGTNTQGASIYADQYFWQ